MAYPSCSMPIECVLMFLLPACQATSLVVHHLGDRAVAGADHVVRAVYGAGFWNC